MATDRQTAEFIVDQLDPLDVRVHPMFGEYALYCGEKVVGFICDDTLFVKPTDAAAAIEPDLPLGTPYPGAKDYLRIDGDRIENRNWLQQLISATAEALPAPKPKRRSRPPGK